MATDGPKSARMDQSCGMGALLRSLLVDRNLILTAIRSLLLSRASYPKDGSRTPTNQERERVRLSGMLRRSSFLRAQIGWRWEEGGLSCVAIWEAKSSIVCGRSGARKAPHLSLMGSPEVFDRFRLALSTSLFCSQPDSPLEGTDDQRFSIHVQEGIGGKGECRQRGR